VNQMNQFILQIGRSAPFRNDLDSHLIRGAMIFIFFAFSIQKWNQYTVEMLVPLISHSPVVFWNAAFSAARRRIAQTAKNKALDWLSERDSNLEWRSGSPSPHFSNGVGASGCRI